MSFEPEGYDFESDAKRNSLFAAIQDALQPLIGQQVTQQMHTIAENIIESRLRTMHIWEDHSLNYVKLCVQTNALDPRIMEVVPRNLFTLMLFNGIYVEPRSLQGRDEYSHHKSGRVFWYNMTTDGYGWRLTPVAEMDARDRVHRRP